MFDVVMEAETRVNVSASLGNIHDRDDSSSLGNIHDRDDQSGRTPQHRACHHWAVQWPALQNGCLNPRGAVLERLQTYIEAGVVSNVILPGRDLLSLRATTPLLGGTSFTATLGAGRGAGCGIASGGSPASRQACPRDSTPTQMPSCLASNSMTLCVCTPVWQWTWVRVPVRGGPALLRSLLHPGAVNGWSMADATVDAGSRLGARTLTRIAPTCTCACTVCPDRNAQTEMPSRDRPQIYLLLAVSAHGQARAMQARSAQDDAPATMPAWTTPARSRPDRPTGPVRRDLRQHPQRRARSDGSSRRSASSGRLSFGVPARRPRGVRETNRSSWRRGRSSRAGSAQTPARRACCCHCW